MEQLARRLTRAWYERGVIALLVLGAGFCLAIYLLAGISEGLSGTLGTPACSCGWRYPR